MLIMMNELLNGNHALDCYECTQYNFNQEESENVINNLLSSETGVAVGCDQAPLLTCLEGEDVCVTMKIKFGMAHNNELRGNWLVRGCGNSTYTRRAGDIVSSCDTVVSIWDGLGIYRDLECEVQKCATDQCTTLSSCTGLSSFFATFIAIAHHHCGIAFFK